MLHSSIGRHSRIDSVDIANLPPIPTDILSQVKHYYDRWGCRKFVPVVLLVLYSVFGAAFFVLLEGENERIMLLKENEAVRDLRRQLLVQLRNSFFGNSDAEMNMTKLISWYEVELEKVKMPPGLKWDFLGALFYVGTLYTTIGYGNIFPRTNMGRAFSVVYAVVGIPLVLAILSQWGRGMTNKLSDWWMIRKERVKKERAIKKQSINPLVSIESGNLGEEEEIDESRTIPVWLALGLCIGWVSGCAGLFCLWESRWSYFTSLYFFCISLSTIGLGDVVPDHPHMLILMFWLVIIGLCIVSMLLSVIQIKMEEWLYNFMIRLKKKYAERLEEIFDKNGATSLDARSMQKHALEDEPWFMRAFAPALLTQKQHAQIDAQGHTFERVAQEWNNKNIQTDAGFTTARSTQACDSAMVC